MVMNYLVLCITFSCHNFSDKAGLILILFLALNSALNPLVYTFLKKDIKKEILKVICRRDDNGKRQNTPLALENTSYVCCTLASETVNKFRHLSISGTYTFIWSISIKAAELVKITNCANTIYISYISIAK